MASSLNDPRKWLDMVPATLHTSPLYSALWNTIKDDPEILSLLELIEKNQPIPITFFTAINFLVLSDPACSLGYFYPYLHPDGIWPASEVSLPFRMFVQEHRETLREILPTARLQTNEVTRCANLLPAFVLAYQRGGQQALNMIEIGSSAGLNLLWVRYGYGYRQGETTPDLHFNGRTQPVQVRCELETTPTFPLSSTTTMPRVARCQGIEICPRNVHDETDMRWVRAAIWPEEVERYRTLDAAIAFARQNTLPVHIGDACGLLPDLLATIPAYQTAVVWHSFAVNQGPPEVQERLHAQIAEASYRLPIYRVSLEMVSALGPRLELLEYRDGRVMHHETLASCAIHGERMTWLLDDAPSTVTTAPLA